MKYLLLLVCLILMSCSHEEPTLVWTKVKVYEVVDVSPSKHVNGLKLKDLQTGEYWNGYYTSKNCLPPVGVRMEFIEKRYKTVDEDWRVLVGVEGMCERLFVGKYKLDWQVVY